MDIIKTHYKLSTKEKETHLHYDLENGTWIMDSSIPKHFRRAEKQGWTPIKKYVYDDGSVIEMILTAPSNAVTIRSTKKKKMSAKQMTNLSKLKDE